MYESRVFGAAAVAVTLTTLVLQRRGLARFRRRVGDVRTEDDAEVTLSLVTNLRRMRRIALPTLWCREAWGTVLFVVLFAFQAWLNVARSTADGRVIQSLLSRHANRRMGISRAITLFVASSLVSSCVTGLIEHVRFALIASYRETLTRYFHRRYFEKLTYYRATVLDDRIHDADTHITKYCHEFAEHFAELPYYFVLPLMEAAMAFYAIVTQVGPRPALAMSTVVLACLALLRKAAPSFGRMHAALLQREDELRRLHSDVKVRVEQVAMHDAGHFTRARADRCFAGVKDALDQLALAKGHFTCIETIVSTAVWDVVGLLVSGVVINNAWKRRTAAAAAAVSAAVGGSPGARAGRSGLLSVVVVQRRLIASFHTAVQAFIVNFREMSHLSEFTAKLAEFDEVLDSLARGEFVRRPDPRFEREDGEWRLPGKEAYMSLTKAAHQRSDSWHLSVMSPALHTPQAQSSSSEADVPARAAAAAAAAGEPGLTSRTIIEFSEVTIVTPNGVVLIENLDLSIEPGETWAVSGPNGCGKSSLLRVLAGMWLPSAGTLTIHPTVRLFFLPQSPYMLTSCAYCDQVTFPDVVERDARGAVLESARERIKRAIALAEATQVVEAVLGGWGDALMGFEAADSARDFDWSSLSGGQQQKTALARLFFHAAAAREAGMQPVAVCDESTSQLDTAAEAAVYRNLREAGVTVISVTHRDSVIHHHKRMLLLTRDASAWSVEKVKRPKSV